MNILKTLSVAALGFASFPLLAQQAGSADPQQASPPSTQAQPQATQPPAASSTATAAVELSPVKGELVSKLDSKTAQTGDSVVIRTQANVKTVDGTEIPKGSKLMGRVVQVKPSGESNDNSQVALQFDHAELKNGQNLPIHAEIQSLSSSDSDTPAAPDSTASMPSSPSASPSAGAGGSMNGSGGATASSTPSGTGQPQTAQSQMSGSSTPSGPAPGTVVARSGNIAIRTTSIPGVLLANNEPGQMDPRMAQASGILLGAKRDIHLDSGTKVVVGVAGTAASGGGN